MGRMKDLFIGIQIAIEAQDYLQLIKELESVPEEYRAKVLLDTVSTLAEWQKQQDANR